MFNSAVTFKPKLNWSSAGWGVTCPQEEIRCYVIFEALFFSHYSFVQSIVDIGFSVRIRLTDLQEVNLLLFTKNWWRSFLWAAVITCCPFAPHTYFKLKFPSYLVIIIEILRSNNILMAIMRYLWLSFTDKCQRHW